MEFARLLTKHVKNKGIAVRFGGEEFMLVLKGMNTDEIGKMLEHIRREYKEYTKHEKNIECSFSSGVQPVSYTHLGGTVALYLLLRFVFDTYIASNVKERFFLHCIFLLPIKPVFPMFDSMPDSVRLNADTIYAVC